jgi:two-component system response regulator FlrC
MIYLAFHLNGFIKKYPLKKNTITVGRDPRCDLHIEEEMISREHVRIDVMEQSIVVRDLNSSNGTYVRNQAVQEQELNLGDSFSIGGIDFYLRTGDLDEFEVSAKLGPVFTKIHKDNVGKFRIDPTRPADDLYTEMLKKILKVGMGSHNFHDFVGRTPRYLSGLAAKGSLCLVSQKDDLYRIHFSIHPSAEMTKLLENLSSNPLLSTEQPLIHHALPGRSEWISIYPIEATSETFFLVFLSNRKDKDVSRFLSSLTGELVLLAKLLQDKDPVSRSTHPEPSPSVRIVVQNPHMKILVERAVKFGQGDLNIMIQGESGTGKELFARLIHNHSARRGRDFVALNCAAIPENLLESELFGNERGAFTGADKAKKGKLEMASGGTLVLDEIGDMHINIQAKLLRALQEQEFYRLGGLEPIRVNLRILSLTNQDIKQLIREGKFRKELYFRLVHRILKIPPLRERTDDIGALINHFAAKFCREFERSINGFSVKTYQALEHYPWEGNVRELENEIRSLINLAEDGATITDELLDDDIRHYYEAHHAPRLKSLDGKSEKDSLIELLQRNGWNKSKTARDLGMTYRGLHKKMLRLNITKPGR